MRLAHLLSLPLILAGVGSQPMDDRPDIAPHAPIVALASLSDGGALAAQGHRVVRLGASVNEAGTTLLDLGAPVRDLALSPDGRTLAVCGGTPAESGFVSLHSWPEAEREPIARHELDAVITSIAWSPTGDRLALGGWDHSARIVDRATLESRHVLEGHSRAVLDVAFLPDGDTLISASIDATLRMWNATTGMLVRELALHGGPVHALAVRPGERSLPMIASVSRDRTVRFWQPTIGRLVRFAKLSEEPLAAAWSAAGDVLAVAGQSGRVRLVDPETVAVRETEGAIDGWLHSITIPSADLILAGGERGAVLRIALDEGDPPR